MSTYSIYFAELNMPPKRKTTEPNIKDDSLSWTNAMDDALIDALLLQQHKGNRVNGTFTIQAYDNVVQFLKEQFPEKRMDKEKLKNHIKYIKKKFAPVWDLFKGGKSGFGWSTETSMFQAEPEVWKQLIEV